MDKLVTKFSEGVDEGRGGVVGKDGMLLKGSDPQVPRDGTSTFMDLLWMEDKGL